MAIFDHFHDNDLNAIQAEGLTFMYDGNGDPMPMDLRTMHATLSAKRVQSCPYNCWWTCWKLRNAERHYLALLLNVASGRLFTGTIVSHDGKTLSQALQEVANLILDGDPSNDRLARRIARMVSRGRMVPVGWIGDWENIAYREEPAHIQPPAVFAVSQLPSPFWSEAMINLTLPEETDYRVTIFNTMGRLVRSFAGHASPGEVALRWDGSDAQGTPVGAGIYFCRVVASKNIWTGKLTRIQ